MYKIFITILLILLISCSSETNEKSIDLNESFNDNEELTFLNTEILNTDVNCEEFDWHYIPNSVKYTEEKNRITRSPLLLIIQSMTAILVKV